MNYRLNYQNLPLDDVSVTVDGVTTSGKRVYLYNVSDSKFYSSVYSTSGNNQPVTIVQDQEISAADMVSVHGFTQQQLMDGGYITETRLQTKLTS